MILHQTRFVTFPRSGHHWLIRELQARLGNAFCYSEHYSRQRETLESNPAINAQKTHDFDFCCPVATEDSGIRHIVQIRDFYSCCKSWHKLPRHKGGSVGSLDAFLKSRWTYYAAFNEKWVISPFVPNRLVVPYDSLLRNFDETINQIINHIVI